MTNEELAAIKARCDRATPGPWAVECWATNPPRFGQLVADRGRKAVLDGSDNAIPNAEFIAHARADIPALIAKVERLREALGKIYSYRSDNPDWNMIMAIAGDIIEPMDISEG